MGWLSIGLGLAMIVADPYHMLTGILVSVYGFTWFAVAPDLDTFYELDKVFVVFLGMYAALPFVMGVFFPETFTKTVLDRKSVV